MLCICCGLLEDGGGGLPFISFRIDERIILQHQYPAPKLSIGDGVVAIVDSATLSSQANI